MAADYSRACKRSLQDTIFFAKIFMITSYKKLIVETKEHNGYNAFKKDRCTGYR